MIIKFIKKKLIKSLVKDAAEALPELKAKVKDLWAEHKDEIIAKAKEAIKEAIVKLAKEKGLIK